MFQPFKPGVFTPTVCAENSAENYAENSAGDYAANYAANYAVSYAEDYTANYIANYAANTVAVSATMRTPSSPPHYESVRHMVFGSIGAVQNTIKLLYILNYAEPNDWSHPVPSGQPGEVVVVLTKKIRMG